MIEVPGLRLANAVQRFLDRNLDQGRAYRICARQGDRTLTYREMARLVGKAANVFAQAGIEYENRVVVVLPDSPELLAAVLGALRIGAVPVTVSTTLALKDYLYIFADCRPKGALIGPEHVAVVDQVRHRLGIPAYVWLVAAEDAPSGYLSFRKQLTEAADECPIHPTSIDDIAVIQYTSGSTGIPKGVVHLHRGLLAVPEGFTGRLMMTADDVCFSAAKLSFGYGFGNSLLFPFSVGASSVLLSSPADALRASDVIQRYRPTIFFAVPSLYAAMLALAARGTELDLSSVRLCVSAGEHLSERVGEQWLERFGLEIINALGSTECLHAFISTEPGRTPIGSSGTAVPGYEAKLLDDKDREVPPGEIGHLWIKGTANAARYWNKHPETIATMVGEWTRTGDLLVRDETGVYHFVGRADDVLKVGGLKVAPTEIEECLLRHPSVMECAVVGVRNEDGVTTARAYVRLNDGWEPAGAVRRQLRNHVRAELAPYKCPQAFEFVDDLPRTTTGKVARYRLRQEPVRTQPFRDRYRQVSQRPDTRPTSG